MPDPSTAGPQPLDGLADPDYRIPPWPDGFDETSFRQHLDQLHARYDMGDIRPRRDRLRTWRDRYTRAQLDSDRIAGRVNFLADLATNCPLPDDENLRTLVVEARRGMPRFDTSEASQVEAVRWPPAPQTITPQPAAPPSTSAPPANPWLALAHWIAG